MKGGYHSPPLTVPCPKCGAEVGRRCLSRTGRKAHYPHQERRAAFSELVPEAEQERLWAEYARRMGIDG